MARVREQAYPIPAGERDKGQTNEAKALQLQAREAITSDAAFDVALMQLALSILGIAGVGFTVYYAHRAFMEAKRSADIAQLAYAADHRPWMMIADEKVLTGLAIEDVGVGEGMTLRVSFNLRNVGNMPAQRVGVIAKLDGLMGLAGAAEHVERDRTKPRRHAGPYAASIFPGEEKPWPIVLDIESAQVEFLKVVMIGGLDSLTVSGVVTYQSVGDDTIHHTSFVYWVRDEMGKALQIPARQPRLMSDPRPTLARWDSGWYAD